MLQFVTSQQRRIVWPGVSRGVEHTAQCGGLVTGRHRFSARRFGGGERVGFGHYRRCYHGRLDWAADGQAELEGDSCEGGPDAVRFEVACHASQAHSRTDAHCDDDSNARAVKRVTDRRGFYGGG